MKSLLLLVAAAVAFVVWQVRQRVGKRRIEEIDSGERCVACNGQNLSVSDAKARCDQCGYVADLAYFRAATVSSDEIAKVTRPESRV